MKDKHDEQWDMVISPNIGLLDVDFKEIWRYRDLLYLFVKREIVSVYKQTILGPLWFFVQPILTTIVFTVVFGNIAGISTDGKPKILFYLSGIVMWNYFSDCITTTSNTFTLNAALFSKVYFPRIHTPLSKVIASIIRLFIQLALFTVIYTYMVLAGKFPFSITASIFYLPLLIIIMAGLGLGLGMIISSLTTKYRDLVFLITFGVQLFMYATPVIYPLNSIAHSKYYKLILYNPLTPVIEFFRASVLGGNASLTGLLYSFVAMVVLMFVGIIIFNREEKTFMDTV